MHKGSDYIIVITVVHWLNHATQELCRNSLIAVSFVLLLATIVQGLALIVQLSEGWRRFWPHRHDHQHALSSTDAYT